MINFQLNSFANNSEPIVTEADLLRRLTLGFNELNFNTSEQNK